MTSTVSLAVEQLYRSSAGRVLATLVRQLGDLDAAEDATQEAFSAAMQQWPTQGVPSNPLAWLVTTGRFKGIDALRRKGRISELIDEIPVEPDVDEDVIADDTLKLIFLCCHPSLPSDGQVALTLREVCGLTTEEIAKCFLVPTSTMAQRIVRAKAKIKADSIPFELPAAHLLSERLDSVLRVAYLVFNEGYYATSGYSLTKASLTGEAIRLGRLLAELLPCPSSFGLLGLMLITESRHSARTDSNGDIVLLGDQERSKWNRDLIAEGLTLSERAGLDGPYAVQAAIAAVHARSSSTEDTDWQRIVHLYDLLLEFAPSPVVALNRAVAVAMVDGPGAGLSLVDELTKEGRLDGYGLLFSVRADFLRRLGRTAEASDDLRRALSLADQEPERRLLTQKINDLSNADTPQRHSREL